MSARPSYCTLGKVRELVDWDDVQIEHVEPFLARFNHGFCLLNAGCVENREEAKDGPLGVFPAPVLYPNTAF